MNDTIQEPTRIPKKRIPGKRTFLTVATPKETVPVTEPILNTIGTFADDLEIEVYLVGGYIRDYYLTRERTDFDFTVVGDSIAFAQKLAKKFKTKPVVFQQFRTAMLPVGNLKLEFVGTRKEEYEPETRNPIVTEGTLLDDLRRRDFTINTMAVSLNKDTFGQLTDIFQGKRDLENKLLRTPIDPMVTFNEDPLRMVRAARFASQLDFVIDKPCLDSAKRLNYRLSIVSQERITDEFLKILASPKPSTGLNLLKQMDLLDSFFPELCDLSGIESITEGNREFAHKDVFNHTMLVLDNIASKSNNLWLRFAALVHDIAKPRTKQYVEGTGWTFHGHEEAGARMMDKIFRRLKLPLEPLEYVEKLVRLHQRPMVLVDDGVTDSAVRRLAVSAGDALSDLFLLCQSDITTNNPKLTYKYLNNYNIVLQKVLEIQEKDKLRQFQSPVKGEEIMEICKLKQSRTVGLIKSAIEEAILDGVINNDYDTAKEFLLQNKDTWLKEFRK